MTSTNKAEEFDLRTLVREVLAEGGCDTFRSYAEVVLGRIPKSQYADALMKTLPDYVRDLDHKPVAVLPTPGTHASPRVQGIANAWSAFIARHITTDLGVQIRLAEATESQVRFYIGLLRVKAAQTERTAESFERIADLMAAQKVGHVKDLPSHLAAPLLKGVAA